MGILVKNNDFFRNAPSLFDDFLTRDFFNRSIFNDKGESLPAVNIQETDRDYLIEVAAPGLSKDDFKIELENNMLVISAQQENSTEEKEENYTRKEFSYQSFKRTFNLQENLIQGDNISAKYDDGILHITVPKNVNKMVDTTRRIEIA